MKDALNCLFQNLAWMFKSTVTLSACLIITLMVLIACRELVLISAKF